MGLNIKNEENCRLAREVAELTGDTMTDATTVARRKRLEREQQLQSAKTLSRKLHTTGPRCARLLEQTLAASFRNSIPRFGSGVTRAAVATGSDCCWSRRTMRQLGSRTAASAPSRRMTPKMSSVRQFANMDTAIVDPWFGQ